MASDAVLHAINIAELTGDDSAVILYAIQKFPTPHF